MEWVGLSWLGLGWGGVRWGGLDWDFPACHNIVDESCKYPAARIPTDVVTTVPYTRGQFGGLSPGGLRSG